MRFSRRRILAGLAVLAALAALVLNHRALLQQPSCEFSWLRRHLRNVSNPPLDSLDRTAALFTTPLKRLGFRGWADLCHDADLTGTIVQVAYSTDDFLTLDIEITQLSLEGATLWNTDAGRRFVRIEFDMTNLRRDNQAKHRSVRQLLLAATGRRVHVRGRLQWDFDGSGHIEIHPAGSDDIQLLSHDGPSN